MSILEIRDVHAYYGDSHVLQGVNLTIENGQAIAVLGRNGAGKTTLLRSIMGLTPARAGHIIFKKQNITHLSPYQIARLGIGLVPQGRRLFGSLTVKEHLDIAYRPKKGSPWSHDAIFSTFPRLKERLNARGRNLSGGEQQMLACGRALIGNPELLLLDEPSEGLAPIVVKELEHIIHKIKEQGITILLVEQDAAFALRLVDYVYVMSRGAIVYESDPERLRRDVEIRMRYLGV